eukprot:SAG31_NODE_1553_length_7905_cov_3.137330_5_plen_454_part_00
MFVSGEIDAWCTNDDGPAAGSLDVAHAAHASLPSVLNGGTCQQDNAGGMALQSNDSNKRSRYAEIGQSDHTHQMRTAAATELGGKPAPVSSMLSIAPFEMSTAAYILANVNRCPLAAQWLQKNGGDPAPFHYQLDAEVVAELLRADVYSPGARPRVFEASKNRWIFKEFIGQRTAVYGQEQDRWHNSGGKRAARDLPKNAPLVRRRSGSIKRSAKSHGSAAGTVTFRYHEYSLVSVDQKGTCVDSGTSRLFHVVQKEGPLKHPVRLATSCGIETSWQGNRSTKLQTEPTVFTSMDCFASSVVPIHFGSPMQLAGCAWNAGPNDNTAGQNCLKVDQLYMGRAALSTDLREASFFPAVTGVVTGLLVRASRPPGGRESVRVSLCLNGEVLTTALQCFLGGTQQKTSNTANGVVDGVAVQPMDDLAVQIVPSDNAAAAAYQIAVVLSQSPSTELPL